MIQLSSGWEKHSSAMINHVGKRPLKAKIILIVEDDQNLLKALQDTLLREGFLVLVAPNGDEGFKMALAQKPNLILLDIVMPVMDGVAMLKKLREDAWGKTVPVFMLTNLNESISISDTMNQKITRYLIKSDWSLHDIVGEIKLTLHI